MSRVRRGSVPSWGFPAAVLLAVLILGLYTGFRDSSHSLVSGPEGVYAAFAGSGIRLLLPLVAAYLGGGRLARELHAGWIPFVRARTDIRRYLTSLLARGVAISGVGFALIGMIWWIVAATIVPTLFPRAIVPEEFGPSAEAVRAVAESAGPLVVLLRGGGVAFGAGVALWLGLHAAMFAALGFVAALVIRSRVLALLFPLAVYMIQSVVAQVGSRPELSFVIGAVYPGGLQRFTLGDALAPGLILAVLVALALMILLARSRSLPRLA
ncbi:hypothetical protein [Mycetocola saprophilus]|uniref:hypothetical protein n=1 Tax=Mycetocola saprophilus TaxID=76636 RepID=UPI003BEFE3C7